MTMLLHQNIPLEEIMDEPDRFDFLEGVRDLVLRMDECHGSEMDDSQYVFLVWVDADDEDRVEEAIAQVARRDDSWGYKISSNGCGLIVVWTWTQS